MRNLLFTLLLILSIAGAGHAQIMRKAAEYAIQRPTREDIVPVDKANQTGQPIHVQVILRTGGGQPVAAREAITLEVTATQPSGQTVTKSVALAPGEVSKIVELSISEPGVTKLRVRHESDQLLESTNYVAVSQATSPAIKGTQNRNKKAVKVKHNISYPRPPARSIPRVRFPRLIRASYLYQVPNEPSVFANDASGPKLMLKVSGENDAEGVPADGVSYARVQVFYMGSEPPQSDIKVWVQQSNGEISANPIIIPRDRLVGETHWTSKWPVAAAKLSVAGTNLPNLPFAGSKEATVAFGAPILGIGFENPPSKITIVDAVTLTAVFFDAAGNPIQTGKKREYRFVSNSPILRLQQAHAEVDQGAADFSAVAIPTFIGESQIEVFSPGYHSAPQKVIVTGLGVLLICIVGGVLGGLLAFINSQGKLWARIVAGVIVGMVASWAYVFLGLPNIQTMILHTQISVLFVSVLAAFSGVKALSAVTKTLNFGF